jgi:hypothetical protein
MPITFTVDPNTQVIYTTASGDIEPEDLIAHGLKLAQANLLDHPQVVDARSANLELTTIQVQRLVAKTMEFRVGLKPTPVAFITDRDSLYGMFRMYQAMTHDINPGFCVFRDFDEAMNWVQL